MRAYSYSIMMELVSVGRGVLTDRDVLTQKGVESLTR